MPYCWVPVSVLYAVLLVRVLLPELSRAIPDLKLLKAKLYDRERQKKAKQIESAYEAKKEIAWGSQIRSYVLHPYSMVKDHRTDCETGNAQAVLEGKIDSFIEAYLKMTKTRK